MKLVQTNQTKGKGKKSEKAVDHFQRCPLCGDSDLIQVSPEVVCSKCDWNSCQWSVSRGCMDNLFGAAIEDMRERDRTVTTAKKPWDDIELGAFDTAVGEEP